VITIVTGDSGALKPYANLLPLVEKLRGCGNALIFDGDGFLLVQDGWCCELRDPIDFDVVEATFVLPDSIVCLRQQDRIVDHLTRSEISGPGELGLRFGSPAIGREPLSEQLGKLRCALATLPDFDRYLLYGRYFKYISTEDLATKTGLTHHAVDTCLWRARKSLRQALRQADQ
jgi:hypothetical protein